MARIVRRDLADGISRIITAQGCNAKGKSLEDFICYLFSLVPGIEIAERNALNAFNTEEVDVALWNSRHRNGFYFLPNILLVECKNWSGRCGSQEVSYFVSRLRQRGRDHGILFATNGITGVSEDLTRAHFEVATALTAGIHVIIITIDDIVNLDSTGDLVNLLKKKLCQLAVSGTNFL